MKRDDRIVVTFVDTDWVIRDKGDDKSPRFELYNTLTKETKAKNNNPTELEEKYWDFIFHGVMKYNGG